MVLEQPGCVPTLERRFPARRAPGSRYCGPPGLLALLKRGGQEPSPLREPQRTPERQAQAADWLCCAACRAPIARVADRLHSEYQVFANPSGLAFELITLRRAQGLGLLGRPTTEATWFSGYAWRIAVCLECLEHLGWHYGAVSGGVSPTEFFGLIRDRLVEAPPE
jgi:hypothetical protein